MKSIEKEEIDKNLGKVFKTYRQKNHLTQENIAEQLGISVKYISRIENGTGGIKLETLVNYINILGIIPNLAFENLILNDSLKKQLEISKKLSSLSDDKIDFILNIIDLLDNVKK